MDGCQIDGLGELLLTVPGTTNRNFPAYLRRSGTLYDAVEIWNALRCQVRKGGFVNPPFGLDRHAFRFLITSPRVTCKQNSGLFSETLSHQVTRSFHTVGFEGFIGSKLRALRSFRVILRVGDAIFSSNPYLRYM